jgi:hypothetical protein
VQLLRWVRGQSSLDRIAVALLHSAPKPQEVKVCQRLRADLYQVNRSDVWDVASVLQEIRRSSEPQWEREEAAGICDRLAATTASLQRLIGANYAAIKESKALLLGVRRSNSTTLSSA